MRGSLAYFLIALVLGAALVLFIADLAGGIGGFQPDGRMAGLVALLAIGIWVGAGMLGQFRGRGGLALQSIAIWLVIALVIALAYTYRDVLGFD